MTTLTMPSGVLGDVTTAQVMPRREGNNICTWIGFKHVNYLVEDAVLAHFRTAGLSARSLYEEHGLGVDVVGLDTRIQHAFHLDEPGTATVTPQPPTDDGRLRFTVTIGRGDGRTRDVLAKVAVALRRDGYVAEPVEPPAELAPFVVDRIGPGAVGPAPLPLDGETGDPVLRSLVAGRNAFARTWRIPYPYCHNNERMQMSGYLRQMEDLVDLFLADRGISIRTMLDTRRWIPVVPHSAIRIQDEALMEEVLYAVYTVEEIFKNLTYRSRMDTYVQRGDRLVQTATGTITHAYAQIDSRSDWHLVDFDEPVLAALRGEHPGAG